jgi:uncharacterized double-CXXCG motif protein
MRFYSLEAVEPPRFSGEYNAANKWGLPGMQCPSCGATWSNAGLAYPCVDLSSLEDAQKLTKGYLERNFEAFERLRERVRPLLPPGVPLLPGTRFGPLVGSARGRFGQICLLYADTVVIRREALEQLQAEGLQGLVGCRTELRYRQKQAPDLWELQLEPHGLLHPDCIPPAEREPCAKCGRLSFSLPQEPILDAATLPNHLDVFRLANFTTLIVASERFVDTVRRLQFEEISFRELPQR